VAWPRRGEAAVIASKKPPIREPDPRYVVGNAVITGYFVLALGVALLLPSVGYVARSCCS
jgi:hypothetical protein